MGHNKSSKLEKINWKNTAMMVWLFDQFVGVALNHDKVGLFESSFFFLHVSRTNLISM